MNKRINEYKINNENRIKKRKHPKGCFFFIDEDGSLFGIVGVRCGRVSPNHDDNESGGGRKCTAFRVFKGAWFGIV
jgi:hypothetical protein